jgi:threonine dehydrogenase-like Zn-dependent dehydrogenase
MLGGWKFANVKDGTLAEYFHVNQATANLALVPDDVSDEQAAYCSDMISTGLVGAEHAAIPPGGTVAVFGQGPVGLMATACARLLGAARVIAVETVPERRALALLLGADHVVDFRAEDPVAAILALTGGEGVDSAIEALGAPSSFDACVRVTRPGGTIWNVGYHGDGDTVPSPRAEWGVGMSVKTIRTGLCPGGAERLRRLLRLVQTGRIDPTHLTTHRFAFAEIERAFEMMRTKADGIVKPLIVFGD